MEFKKPGVLIGPSVRLEPIAERHREELRSVSLQDQSIWKYFPIGFNGEGDGFDKWFDNALDLYSRSEHYPFVVKRNADEVTIGTTRYYDMAPAHQRLAIGSTWYGKDTRGTLVNSEVRLLTLTYAFERLSVIRVELITDPRNLSSQAAMKILGVVQEGVIRNHLTYSDGRVRDSLLFSIIATEWSEVKSRLYDKLGYEAGDIFV
jgi:N-acetyltransferase